MGKINSRKKGSKNERMLCKLFQTWTKKEFARTPSSGGLNWKNSHTVGDIVCTTEGHFFPFAVEAKFHEEINFEHLLYLDEPQIMKFWAQAEGDSTKGKTYKIPLLFMRYNGMPKNLHFVMLKYEVWVVMRNKLMALPRKLQFHKDDHNFVILTTEEFFKIDYKEAKAKLKSSPLWPKRKK